MGNGIYTVTHIVILIIAEPGMYHHFFAPLHLLRQSMPTIGGATSYDGYLRYDEIVGFGYSRKRGDNIYSVRLHVGV
jgi:hypothetical protein